MSQVVLTDEILNYSFCKLDIGHYLDGYLADRTSMIAHRLNIPSQDLDFSRTDVAKLACEICTACEIKAVEQDGAEIHTATTLQNVIARIAEYGTPNVDEVSFVEAMQKKFEVFHRVFSRYDVGFRRVGEVYDDLRIYGLLSVVLLLLFRIRGNLNHLNTSIKLNDLILKSDLPVRPADIPLYSLALGFERSFVRESLRGNLY